VKGKGRAFRGRSAASLNAISPMRLDARSVIKRVALARLPEGESSSVSCLTYCATV